MKKNYILPHGGKLFISWFSRSCTLEEIDDWVNYRRLKYFDPEEWMVVEAGIDTNTDGPGYTGQLVVKKDPNGTQFAPFKAPDPKKPVRIRLANAINLINQIYDTLRKVNFAINLDLKEDIVSETIIYFMSRWDYYEYHPNCIPIAVQKYKSINIDTYRKDKRKVSLNDDQFSYIPKSLESYEGLPLKELEEKEDFKKMKLAISKMKPDCREILMLIADGKSESEIQKILDIPLGTVSSRKSNCIKKLAEILKI
jgi:RNA polymerase sigma factor (sigma-70 family)